MDILCKILMIINIASSFGVISLVLIQHGKGADMGVTFGNGTSSLFGASGSASFFSRLTAVLAAFFFFNSTDSC